MPPSLRHDRILQLMLMAMESCFVSPRPVLRFPYRRQQSPAAAACNARDLIVHSAALLLVVHSVVAAVTAQPQSTPWSTLTGGDPIVIARGGFSGMYPDSSKNAYILAMFTSVSNVVLWCDVQLTQDGVGICFPELILDNASYISSVDKDKGNTYLVNQAATTGYFTVDYPYHDLSGVALKQGIDSRTPQFDGQFYIKTVKDVAQLITQYWSPTRTPGLWLNIQNSAFYAEHSLNMTKFVLNITTSVEVNYISSPEVGFLTSLKAGHLNTSTTNLVFRFLGKTEIEPSTNQTYGSLLTKLAFIKTFASGILVPKTYIWPVDEAMYLQPHTTLVTDAHKSGLQVYASDFMNDAPLSYNYSYDPTAEYLDFIDNGNFSVDGVLSDFPITPSDAIVCFSNLGKKPPESVTTLVISKNGASGDYPNCTDKAYEKAITDGVDILDCPVQMTKDGIPFCFGSMDLIESTTVAESSFSNRSLTSIPEINAGSGVYTFSLTWEEIQTLKPQISNPFYYEFKLIRNPKHKNDGKFLSLSDFLALTKSTKSLTGFLINIKNAAYLAEYQGLGVIDAVLDAFTKAGYDKKNTQRVMIQSTNSSVLKKFKEKSKHYELVYEVDEVIRGVSSSTIEGIKEFAHSVVIDKNSVFPEREAFLNKSTGVVAKLQESNLHVYVETFANEFVSQPRDFFSDPIVEIDAYVMQAGVDGVITAFPKTAAMYKRSTCKNYTPADFMPGYFRSQVAIPAAEAPSQVLTVSDVAEPPLPPVSDKVPPSTPGAETAAASTILMLLNKGQSCSCVLLASLAMVLAEFFLF